MQAKESFQSNRPSLIHVHPDGHVPGIYIYAHNAAMRGRATVMTLPYPPRTPSLCNCRLISPRYLQPNDDNDAHDRSHYTA